MKDNINKLYKSTKNYYYDLCDIHIPALLKKIKLFILRKFEFCKHSNTCFLAVMLTLTAFFCFATTYFTNMFTIPLGGDFVLQEIPFIFNGYDDWKYFFKTGEFVLWDTSGFLGVNNIGANQFYYLTSPWFLIYLLFPRNILPQVQGILTMVKLVTGGLLFNKYLESFNIKKGTRNMGSIAFAFCGWMFYNLWFHFIDAAVLLPLLLLGFEKVFKNKGPFTLIAGIVLLGFTNFFFLSSFCLASIPYVLFRLMQLVGSKQVGLKDFSRIALDGVVGVALGLCIVAVALLPSVFSTINMPRVSSASDEIPFFTFPKPYEAIYPLCSFLFMNITCFSTNLFRNNYYNNTMSSIFVFTPFVLMMIPSLIHSIAKKKYSYLVGYAGTLFMLFTPFFYYFFHAFTIGYGRWEIMAVCWMIVFFCKNYDERRSMPKFYLDISLGVVIGLMVIASLFANKVQADNPDTFHGPDGRNILVPLQAAYLIICYIIMRTQFHKKRLTRILFFMMAAEAIVQGNVTIIGQGVQKYQDLAGGLTNLREERNIANALNNFDDSFYRVYTSTADRGANNIQMRIGYNGVSTFNSTYAFELNDLLGWSKINYNYGTWSMSVNEKRNNLEALLGIKYYVLKSTDQNVPYGYRRVKNMTASELNVSQEKYEKLINVLNDNPRHHLYYNTNYIQDFFVYDTVISSNVMYSGDTYTPTQEVNNEVAYLKYAILDKEEIDDLKENDMETYNRLNGEDKTIDSSTNIINTARSQNTTFSYDNNKLNIKINIPNWNSSGYIEGWEEYIKTHGEPSLYDELEDPIGKTYDYKDYIQQIDPNTGINMKIPYYSRLILEPVNGTICPKADGTKEKSCFVSVNSKLGHNITYYMIDEEGKMYKQDSFYWNGYSKTYDWKYARGFYVDKPIKKVVGFIKEDINPGGMLGGLYKSSSGYGLITYNFPSITYSNNSDYQKDIDRLKEEGKNINLIKHSANDIFFETNFSENRFVVINQPIDNGWKLTRNGEAVRLYKTQGGLIGFEGISSDEPIYYELSYCPEGYKLGSMLTIAGLLSTLFLSYIYIFLTLNKKISVEKFAKSYNLKKSKYDKEVWERNYFNKKKRGGKHHGR